MAKSPVEIFADGSSASPKQPNKQDIRDYLIWLQGQLDPSGSGTGVDFAHDLTAHINDQNNPHDVTADQIGLGNINERIGVSVPLYGDRPGEAPENFVDILTGGDPVALPELSLGTQISDENGHARRITGAGVLGIRAPYPLEPNKVYLVEFVIQRRVDTPDPSNDAVRCALAWYNQGLGPLTPAFTVVRDITTLVVGNGRQVISAVVSRSPGGVIDIVAPADARYVRPYIQTYGISTVTDIEVIRWTDITNATTWSPDVTALEERVSAQESLALGPRVTVLEGQVTAPDIVRLAYVPDIDAATIPVTANILQTLHFNEVGDGGGSYYLRSDSEPDVPPLAKRRDATGQWWVMSPLQDIYPEMFGARADPLVDDRAAIQAAMDFSLITKFRNRVYYSNGPLTWRSKQQLLGSLKVNGSSVSDTGGSRIVFSGSGTSCLVQEDQSQAWNYGGIEGVTLRCVGSYDWIVDVYSASAMQILDCELQPVGIATGGFRSQKISPTDNSWLNVFQNTNIILPNGSTARPLDIDWSDSVLTGCTFSGGLGNFSRGYGNKITNNNFERASNAGLTLKAKYTGVGELISSNFFDANTNYGLVVDPTDDPSTSVYQVNHIAICNKFRTVNSLTGATGIADIYLKSDSAGRVFNGGIYASNSHSVSGAVPLLRDPAYWGRVQIGFNHVLNTALMPFSTEILDTAPYVGYKGLNVPNGIIVVRGNFTQFGMPNVCGFFGVNGSNPNAGVQLGAIGGTQPFIGASRSYDGTATDLRIYTDATERLRLHSGGTYFRPAIDNAMSLGTSANRLSQLFAVTPTINTSDEREKEDIDAIPDAVLDAWGDVEWVQFKFKDAAAEKGTAARIHTGLIAQRVKAVFEARGLDATEYGLLCYDEWVDQHEPVMATRMNDAGEEELYDTGETKLVLAAGNRYGIRYEEALAMESAYQRRRMADIEAKIANLTAA